MNRLILISVVSMQFGWICGAPNPAGVGAYAYQDSAGNRFAPFNTGFGNYGNFGSFGMPNFGPNSAFASGVAMPGYSHQIASINPENPSQPNVNIQSRFGAEDNPNPNNGQFMSVSSSSYATSSNVNGKEQTHRGAETTVNNNGVVKHYKVES